MKGLKGKLKEEFEVWLSNDFIGSKDHETDCYIYNNITEFPLSNAIQFVENILV